MRVDEGKKGPKSSRDKNARGKGERSLILLICDPGSELRLLIGGRENRRAKMINGMEKINKNKNE